jgi:hypothetical protein
LKEAVDAIGAPWTNQFLQYEEFKVKSVQRHYYIQEVGQDNDEAEKPVFQDKSYDPDSAGQMDSGYIRIRANCKRKFLKRGVTYKQTLRPHFGSCVLRNIKPGGNDTPVTKVFRNKRHDQPWFDCKEGNNGQSIAEFPNSDNAYYFVWNNSNVISTVPTTLYFWDTYIVLFRGESRTMND